MNLRTGLGCIGRNDCHGGLDDRESIAAIHRYFDLGGNFLDSTDRETGRGDPETGGEERLHAGATRPRKGARAGRVMSSANR
jgi:hypothetical protein